ncbi:MAG: hypothetical protein ABI306_09805 [Caulobacteraceae bacterium]
MPRHMISGLRIEAEGPVVTETNNLAVTFALRRPDGLVNDIALSQSKMLLTLPRHPTPDFLPGIFRRQDFRDHTIPYRDPRYRNATPPYAEIRPLGSFFKVQSNTVVVANNMIEIAEFHLSPRVTAQREG